ncbi:MAG: D-2-hydroxyacid dehydrogenase [Anaerolineae bacterium]|jgi:D-3-phosphoglycerate dehydrogenase|nr:D-2-hydroxyacid dehydrogenase [Anaerolineae bacterium]MDH7472663.1 D-2-hydroxyacid dehydrogenase [Anaerolineae bacterium]
MKLLICDPTDIEAIEKMRTAGIEVDVRDDISAEELMKVIPVYHAMVVRSRTKVRQPLIDVAKNLKLIIRGGVGLDNIDADYACSKGITVVNTPAASSVSVAELTIGYLFALARKIPDATASMRAGQWEKKAFSEGTELTGKTLGLIGCGRIGQEVAKRAAALEMNVLFYRRTKTDVPYATQVSLDELLAKSDYISLHVPLTEETYHIIGAPEFAKMKDGVYIINCGRGGTLDEAALYEAIVSGKVAGAALDVFEDEKDDRGKKLFTLPQVIGSPHIGAGTVEATARVGGEVAELAIAFYRENF